VSPVARLRISVVEYLNTAPLVWGFTHGPLQGRYDLSFTVPSRCAEQLASGAVDIAILPAIEYQRIPGLVVLPDAAIASKRAVRSLLVVSKVPIAQVRRMALDTSSRSTVALTRILCAEHWRIAPEFVDAPPDVPAMLSASDAALVIGDPALRLAEKSEAGEQVVPGLDAVQLYDVVEQWRQWTGHPCVLAFWAARREAATPEVVADFLASKQYGLERIDEIASNASVTLGLSPASLARYLRENIDFSLDAENRAGLALYFQKAARAGLIPAARSLEFAAAPARAGVRG
jgi:chorismate dehydratase